MSDIMPMYAIDKIKQSFLIDVIVKVRLLNRSKQTGLSLNEIVNTILLKETHLDPFGEEDEAEVRKIILSNLSKREKMKRKKGIYAKQ